MPAPTLRDTLISLLSLIAGIVGTCYLPLGETPRPGTLTTPTASGLESPACDCTDVATYQGATATVTRVLDGDTYEIDRADRNKPFTRVRCLGINAPERTRGKKLGQPYGEQAATLLRDLIMGKTVRLTILPQRSRGVYGRLLAYTGVIDGPSDVEGVMLRAGAAWADPRWAHPRSAVYNELMTAARTDNVGLWPITPADGLPAYVTQ